MYMSMWHYFLYVYFIKMVFANKDKVIIKFLQENKRVNLE